MWTLDIEVPANGRYRKATINVRNEQKDIITTDKADMVSMEERGKLAKRLARRLDSQPAIITSKLETAWQESLAKHRKAQAELDAAKKGEADQSAIEVLDKSPPIIRRPLCLIDGIAYAGAWLHFQITVKAETDPETGQVTYYDPPRVRVKTNLVIVRGDGRIFADPSLRLPNALPIGDLKLEIALPLPPLSSRAWSGAGVKRFLAGERPDPAVVFRQCKGVAGRFMDFNRSLSTQEVMCELIACFVIATYLLDGFNVAGYLWPNGDKGTGKTNLLIVATEMAYLGTLILAGGSYASLRDLADYGATLAFDDAEGVMDSRKSDPDKRALLLAGNRRGATVTVKELVKDEWQTRHVDTFCFRLFSAIRLPDDVLASRTITTPLVRSADRDKANADPMDYALWPYDRRRLVDDLWAVGLMGLPMMREHEAAAVSKSTLSGRDLQPWRAILAVAHWLQERHGVTGLFDRMVKLSVDYQAERGELEENDPVRIAIRALDRMLVRLQSLKFAPKQLADMMHQVAVEDGLADEAADKKFISPQRVGWLLKRLRLEKADRNNRTKNWSIDRTALDALARAYGMAPAQTAEEKEP
jgi:hypothetical protein